jgi:hypothetical protein
MIENGDTPADFERDLRAHIAGQHAAARLGEEIATREERARAVLARLSDAQLIDSARRIAATHGPLSVLITALLDRFEAHMARSLAELTAARDVVERLAKAKAAE